MSRDELQYMVSQLPDEAISGLLEAVHNEVTARRDARNAALPDDVWLTARQGHPSQVTREQAQSLINAGTHEMVTAPQGVPEPSDMCWVATKLGHVVQVPKVKAIELLDASTHRLAQPEEYGAKA